jgi:intein/homing endonuclease
MSKRKLTDDEIQAIVSELKIIGPRHFKKSIHENVISKLVHQLTRVELYPDMYQMFKDQIIEQYYKSHISPGENVGILTAQSIGEKQTQMSVAYDEQVYIKYMGFLKKVYIGKFIEDTLSSNSSRVVRISNHSWILDTNKDDLYTSSIDKNGIPSWSKITCLSKHDPNGDLVKIKTKSGKEVTCTYSHSLLTRDVNNQVIPIEASNVKLGTVLPILNDYTNLFKFGKTLSHNTAKMYALFKKCNGKIIDNNVHFNCIYQDERDVLYNYAQCNMIECTIKDTTIIYHNTTIPDLDCSLYVLYNGTIQDVQDYIDTLRQDGNGKYTLQAIECIYGENVKLMLNVLKSNFVSTIHWDPIISLKNINEHEYKQMYNYVYDFSVDTNETFMLSNGLFVHNTLNSVVGSELIHYYDSQGINHITTIGHFIDTCLEQSQNQVQLVPENHTEYLKLQEPIHILSVTEEGQVEWSKVTAVTRHDIKPGDLIRVETKLGHTVVATKYKSFFTRFNNKLIQKTTQLEIGDIFPIVQKSPFIESNQRIWQGYELDYDFGFLIGMYYFHGNTNEYRTVIHTCNIKQQNIIKNFAQKYCYKYVDYFNGVYIYSHQLYNSLHILSLDMLPSFLFSAPYECLVGLMYSIFFNKCECKIELTSLQKCVCEIAARFGLVCSVKDNLVSIVNQRDYTKIIEQGSVVIQYDLNDRIPGITTFIQNGTFSRGHLRDFEPLNISDQQILRDTINQTVYYDTVVNITPIYDTPKVYDLTVDNKTFSLLGGALVYDTFHTAGLTVKTVVSGVPRFMELMNTTKEPKSASCSIKVPVSDTIKGIYDIRNYIGDKLRCLSITKILYDYTIVSYQDVKTDWWIVDEQFPIELVDDDRVLRLQLSHKLIYEYRCSLTSIVNKINSVFTDIYTVCSSLNECIVDVFILNKGGVTLDKKVCHVTEENKYDVFLEEIVLAKLDKFIISGVEKINDYMISTIKPGHEWMISTEGSNLKGLMELDLFDFNNVMSNNMWEIYNLLGIEATREFLIREFTDVISSDGTFINKCHIILLVDTMTCKGDITSISRYSLRSKSSVLSRSSFEESIENFLKSGIFSEIDKMTSISSNIMTGKLSRVGTGISDVILTDTVFEKQEIYPSESIYNVNHKLELDEHDDIMTVLPRIFSTI